MTPVIIIGAVVLVAIIGYLLLNKDNFCNEESENEVKEAESTQDKFKEMYKEQYCKKSIFTDDEKESYKELKKIADELGYTIFLKVRVLDLIELVKDYEALKISFIETFRYEYFDFVLLDEEFNVKYIINYENDRRLKDVFFDEKVEAIGYKVIYVSKIDESLKDRLK